MRALIAKEIREHLAAPVLAFVVLAVLVAANTIKPANAELFSPTSFRMGPVGSYLNYRDPTAPVPLVSGSFLGTYVVVACALAIVLGALMSWNEQLRHTWDFLIHRPVTRTRILLSKLLAGAVMYLLAVLVPLAWLSCWCAIPGNIPAPWTMSYVLRGLDTVTVGFLLFVASFLCGVRTARWYGTRFMPLLVCVCIVLVMATMQSIAAFYAAACLLLAVLLAAVWSVFVRQTAGGRFATTCLICAGVVAATVFSAYIVLGYLTAPFVTDQPEPSVGWTTNGEPRVVYTYYQTGKCVMKTLDDEIVKETACTWSGSSGLVPMAALASWSPFPAAWFPGARAPSVQVVPGSYYRPLLVDYDGGYVVEYDQPGRVLGARRNAAERKADPGFREDRERLVPQQHVVRADSRHHEPGQNVAGR
jgi:ABC-type transport system involved in multi-copper enzyme maturation permease subunit